jgi:hypothetical protein
MPSYDQLLHQRLSNQWLQHAEPRTPADVVSWLGAVQSQDFTGAKWALGLRAPGLSNADVDRAFDAGAILRTHVLRPTWHFVAPADIRWLLALTGPRVHAVNASYYRQQELDPRTLARSRAVFEHVLHGGKHLTRTALAASLQRAGISASGLRLALLVMHAELDAVICSGPRQGKQFTYALLEERVPRATALTHDEALEALTRRYFTSHGPATLRDYVWWSGLTVREARLGLELARTVLEEGTVGDRVFWWTAPVAARPRRKRAAHLLPNYDEYLIAYKDREPVLSRPAGGAPGEEFAHHLVIDGRLAGSWKRTTNPVGVEVKPYGQLTAAQARALDAAVAAHRAFFEVAATSLHRRRGPTPAANCLPAEAPRGAKAGR